MRRPCIGDEAEFIPVKISPSSSHSIQSSHSFQYDTNAVSKRMPTQHGFIHFPTDGQACFQYKRSITDPRAVESCGLLNATSCERLAFDESWNPARLALRESASSEVTELTMDNVAKIGCARSASTVSYGVGSCFDSEEVQRSYLQFYTSVRPKVVSSQASKHLIKGHSIELSTPLASSQAVEETLLQFSKDRRFHDDLEQTEWGAGVSSFSNSRTISRLDEDLEAFGGKSVANSTRVSSPNARTSPSKTKRDGAAKRTSAGQTGRPFGYGQHGTSGAKFGRKAGKKQGGSMKYLCTFYIGIEESKEFSVRARLLGQGGKNMKCIASRVGRNRDCGLKMRLRGVGSGFKEHDTGHESNEPLQLNLSVADPESYVKAKSEVCNLMQKMYNEYSKFSCGRFIKLHCVEHPHNPALT